jgi:hypothetical protein
MGGMRAAPDETIPMSAGACGALATSLERTATSANKSGSKSRSIRRRSTNTRGVMAFVSFAIVAYQVSRLLSIVAGATLLSASADNNCLS